MHLDLDIWLEPPRVPILIMERDILRSQNLNLQVASSPLRQGGVTIPPGADIIARDGAENRYPMKKDTHGLPPGTQSA